MILLNQFHCIVRPSVPLSNQVDLREASVTNTTNEIKILKRYFVVYQSGDKIDHWLHLNLGWILP